jgi:hypothetical protein
MSEQATYKYDVFISYSHKDQFWVQEELCPILESVGLRACIDIRDFEIGVPSVINMERAVKDSRHTLIILTPSWVESQWTEFESLLTTTLDPAGRQKLIPLMLIPCQLPTRIAMLTYADFTNLETRLQQMSRLLRALGVNHNVIERNIGNRRTRIFISYKRDSDTDESVVYEVFQVMRQHYDVFIDQTMEIGENWPNRIREEISQADFLICFLSSRSIYSEMFQEEIRLAQDIAKVQAGIPTILPVRLNFREPLPYPLSQYLDHINWAYWSNTKDTQRLIADLMNAIDGNKLPLDADKLQNDQRISTVALVPTPTPSAQPVFIERPDGTVDPQSVFYIERLSDTLALDAIKERGVTITIKGPRQMGKSSLLMRTLAAAQKDGKRVAFLDFQQVDRLALADADVFFQHFASSITDELGLEDRVKEFWDKPYTNSRRCTRYMGNYVLKQLDSQLVLVMDEVETVFDTEFRSDFFGMLRAWHNRRANPIEPIWKTLDLALVTSTEPYQLIDNLNQSPFNVGEVIELVDFTPQQVTDLNHRHGSPLTPSEETLLMAFLNGHPYLVRRALYLVATRRITISELLATATADRGPFGDHLRYHLFRMHSKPDLIHALLQVIRHHTCQDEQAVFRLHGAGLVRRDGHAVLPRCNLYADYFVEHLHG